MLTRTSISFNLPVREAERTRKLAKKRGFGSTAEYLRFLLSEDDEELISREKLITLSKDTDRLYKEGKLIKATSLAEFMK